MKSRKTLLVLAAAGLLGVGAGLAFTSGASADTFQHRCNRDGCWTVACNDNGDCRRLWDNHAAYRHRYIKSAYDMDRANGHYVGNRWVDHDQDHRRTWTCDHYGANCHWVYESF